MFEALPATTPVHFFAIGVDCHYLRGKELSKIHELPSLSSLTGDKKFATVAIGWNEKGLYVEVTAQRPITNLSFGLSSSDSEEEKPKTEVKVFFPDITSGDSVELFIDTRDVKNHTRFCHHFFFLPQPVQTNGVPVQAGEITRFRTEDSHELCDPETLVFSCDLQRKGYTLKIFLPAQVLHGYDPAQCNRFGFTYRINRYAGPPEHFSLSSQDFPIEQLPSSWATLNLIKEQSAP